MKNVTQIKNRQADNERILAELKGKSSRQDRIQQDLNKINDLVAELKGAGHKALVSLRIVK